MSATRVEPDAAAIGAPVEPVRMMPGPLGLDSPPVPDDGEVLPLGLWHAWMDLVDDRAAGRASTPYLLERAMGRRLEELWGLWWLAHHRDVNQRLLHRARVCRVLDGGETLVSACGLTLPWGGPDPNIVLRVDVPQLPENAGLVQCAPCAENDPRDPAHGRVEHVWQGGGRAADPS